MYAGNKQACGPHRLVNTDKLDTNFILDENDCHRWSGAHNIIGYSFIGFRWREGSPLYKLNTAGVPCGMMTAHKAQLIRKLGREIEPGMMALHTCHTLNCVNPDHLYEGTKADKMQHMVEDNRTRGYKTRQHSHGTFTYDLSEVNWIRNCVDGHAVAERFNCTYKKAVLMRSRIRWHLHQEIEWPERSLHLHQKAKGKRRVE